MKKSKSGKLANFIKDHGPKLVKQGIRIALMHTGSGKLC
jgi:hypothetical protein